MYCYALVTENGQKCITPLLVAPVDVRNVHLGEYLTQHRQSPSVTGENLFSLTCQTPKTANIQGTLTVILVIICMCVSRSLLL